MKKDSELLKAVKELKEEVRYLRDAVATLLDIVMGMRYEIEEEVAPLDAHKTSDKFSTYHG
ncbi:MAG: hypothetical protein AB1485_08375 [Candidatus Thermoplasmatota archaeon]